MGRKNIGINHSSNKQAKSLTWLRKGNLKRETESLLIATQKKKNALKSNNVKARIEKTHQNVHYVVIETKRSIILKVNVVN